MVHNVFIKDHREGEGIILLFWSNHCGQFQNLLGPVSKSLWSISIFLVQAEEWRRRDAGLPQVPRLHHQPGQPSMNWFSPKEIAQDVQDGQDVQDLIVKSKTHSETCSYLKIYIRVVLQGDTVSNFTTTQPWIQTKRQQLKSQVTKKQLKQWFPILSLSCEDPQSTEQRPFKF